MTNYVKKIKKKPKQEKKVRYIFRAMNVINEYWNFHLFPIGLNTINKNLSTKDIVGLYNKFVKSKKTGTIINFLLEPLD